MYDDIAAHGGRADHVEDRPFADQEQAQGGACGAGRRDERAHVFRRPLLRLRRRDLRVVPPARNRQPRGPEASAQILADLPQELLHSRDSPRLPRRAESSTWCARPPNIFRAHYEVIEIDGVRVKFPDGWGLVRASNTQPALVMRFEASDQKASGRDSRAVREQAQRIGRDVSAAKGERAHHRRRPRHALLAGEPCPAPQAAVFDRRPQLAARGHYRAGRADNRARANLRAGLCRPARDFPQSAPRPDPARESYRRARVLAAPRSRSHTDARRLRIAPVRAWSP